MSMPIVRWDNIKVKAKAFIIVFQKCNACVVSSVFQTNISYLKNRNSNVEFIIGRMIVNVVFVFIYDASIFFERNSPPWNSGFRKSD